MTINQLVFNTPTDEIISVSFELEQFISNNTTDQQIEQVVSDVSEVVRKHFKFYRDQKANAEKARLEKEAAEKAVNQKTAKVFSSFKSKPASVAKSVKTPTMEDILPVLTSMNKISTSYLPNVYRFPGSPYAYTVKDNTWVSPFGESGTDVEAFLKDIGKRVFHLEHDDVNSFVTSVMSQVK